MKKLSLSLAISLASMSSAVNAVTILETKKGFKYDLKGDIQVQLRQRAGIDEDVHVDFDDSELKNRFSYDIGNGYTAFAETHIDTGKDVGGDVEAEETFVGFDGENFTVQLGRMDYATDEFATEIGIEHLGPESAFDAADAVGGSDVLLAAFEAGNVEVVISHDFGESSRNTEASSTDIFVAIEVASNLVLGLAGQSYQEDANADDSTGYGISISSEIAGAEFAVDYSKLDDKRSDPDLVDLKVTNAWVKFPIANSTKLGLGITNQSNRADTVDDSWYANVVYKFPKAKKVSVFAEVQDSDADNGGDVGFLAGMRVKF